MLWNWTHQLIDTKSRHPIDNGIIALKGGDLTEELNELGRPYQITDISDYFGEEFFKTKKIVYIPR
jgi:16S rRNA (guanine527-N7)-methyltransferase